MSNNKSSLLDEFDDFRSEMNSYRNHTQDFFNSTNYLFKTAFLDYEMTDAKFILSNLQLLSLELLDFVKKVCIKHDIKWWLDFGNLLGAVRHGTYVPWDEDTDIGMLREDYLRFDKVIAQEVMDNSLDDIVKVGYRPFKPGIPKFVQLIMVQKVKRGRMRIVGNVDVFPYEYIREFDENTIYDLYAEVKEEYLYRRKKNFNRKATFDKYYDDLNLSWEPTDYIIPGWENCCTPGDMYPLVVYEAKNILPLKEIKFAGRTFPCPNNPHYYLKKLYRDYMNIPKSLRKHDRVTVFRYRKDNEEVFNHCLKKIQYANENFKY